MKNIIALVLGMLVLLEGVGFTLPGLLKLRDLGAMPGDLIGVYTLGVVLALVGGSLVHYGLSNVK
jgi:hypothetical protein